MRAAGNSKIGHTPYYFVHSVLRKCQVWFSAGSIGLCLSGCAPQESPPEEEVQASMSPAVQEDWPLFRGDAEMRGYSPQALTPPLSLAWTYEPETPSGKRRPPIEASPVIAKGRVYVGSQDGNFYALELESGRPAWIFKADGPIIAPAAALSDRICFGDTHGVIYALSLEGQELWRFETEGKIEGGVNVLETEGQPSRVFVGSHDYFVYCLDAASGELLWKQETGNYVVSTPSLVSRGDQVDLVFGGCDGLLHVLPAHGEGEKREIEIGAYVANTSAVSEGVCYVAHNGGEIVAIEIEGGSPLWTAKTGIEYSASPAVDAQRLYVGGPDKRLVAYDRQTGAEVWAFQSRRSLTSSPLVSGGIVWQGGMDGRLYAVDAEKGEELWNFELGTQIKASPAASRGTLVLCGVDGAVYAFRQ